MNGSTTMTRPIGVISSIRPTRMIYMADANRKARLPEVIRMVNQARAYRLLMLALTRNGYARRGEKNG